ncbi:transient receptor potential cation channel subfamily M member-like 2 isoform X2 [Octopus sinensis]|uniref:Transient receptor potential cation channel subfamily M member-like 2 isoform X2 n=1 Tax=Octopus sinensis TaxID=2607531 RepID=A0A7E6FER8_9MOLL|nr:transient receptor potential cation channel subfamily M member-like 2 isoform X2 [Octopus sinensis]
MAEVSGQKTKQPETRETQIQPPMASTSFDIPERQEMAQVYCQKPKQPQASERLIQRYFKPTFVSDILSNKPAVDGFTNKSKKSDKKWIEENIKLRNSKDEEPSKPCDAFGTVNFVEHYPKTATFVRVDHQASMEIMMCLIKSTWNIRLPSLLISVIGGREDIQLNPHTEAVGRGLYKAARTIDAWIITEGLHTGVAKYIGEVMHNKENKVDAMNEVTTLGIAPWNCVLEEISLVNKQGSWPAHYFTETNSKKEKYALDPNHSHFILVDDGTKDNFGEIIEFRKKLEHTISQEKIPETGFKVPAVAVMVGGELETLKSVSDSISRNIPVVIVKGTGQAADVMAYAYERVFGKRKEIMDFGSLQKLKTDIRKKITEEFEGWNIKQVNNTGDWVLSSLRRPNLLTVCDINSDEDFGVAILKAVFKTKIKSRNLKLTFKWERLDNALNKLFIEGTSWQINKLDNVMLFALKEGKSDIVELFLEYKINLKELLTETHINTLFDMLNTYLTDTCEEFLNKFLKNIHQEEVKFCFETKLFLWALFLNRKEMASLFWKEGMGALSSALIANNLLKSLKGKCKEYGTSTQLQEQADNYENHAIGILDECLYTDEKQTLDLLLLQQKMWNNSSNMQIAFDLNNEKFMAHDACQSVLTKIWMKQINKTNSIWKLLLCILCPLFLFLIKFDSEEQNSDMEPKETCCSKPHGIYGIRKCMKFYNTPVIKFWISLIFYVIFLGIYSYVLLVELKPQRSFLEWLLIMWVIGIFTEEIHQVLTKRSLSIRSKFKKYIHSAWNINDVITIVLFILGYILRSLDVAETARVIFCLNLISFYIRFLHMFSIDKNLGPKLVMIKEMMRDLGYFAMIMFIFMTAFGIATQSILNPSTPASFDLFKEVFRKAYFLIYAEFFLEEYDGNPNCKENNSTCPTEITTYSAIILMCIYVLLTNILLLNLLIAMFSSTYEKVQKKSHLHWSFQRYDIINEFSIRPPLPPPFIILSNIYQFCRYLYQKTKDQGPGIKYVFSHKYDHGDASKLLEWEHKMVQSYLSRQHKPDSNDKDLINQLKSKVEELQHNVDEKMENIDTSLAWIKENLMKTKP